MQSQLHLDVVTTSRSLQVYHTSRDIAPRSFQVMWMQDFPKAANHGSSLLFSKFAAKRMSNKIEVKQQKTVLEIWPWMTEICKETFKMIMNRPVRWNSFPRGNLKGQTLSWERYPLTSSSEYQVEKPISIQY